MDPSTVRLPTGWELERHAIVAPCTDGVDDGFYNRYVTIPDDASAISDVAVNFYTDLGWESPVGTPKSTTDKFEWKYSLLKTFDDWNSEMTITLYGTPDTAGKVRNATASLSISYPPEKRC